MYMKIEMCTRCIVVYCMTNSMTSRHVFTSCVISLYKCCTFLVLRVLHDFLLLTNPRYDIGDEDGMSSGDMLGHMEEFDGTKGDWPLYAERLEHFFATNGITDEGKQRAVLSVIGATTYRILRNVVSPSKPGEKTYAALVEALSQHFKPKPSKIVERLNSTVASVSRVSQLQHT